jgi:hypothetical protein
MPELALPETGSPRVLALTEGLYGVIDAMSPDRPAPHLPATARQRKFGDRVQTWLDETLGGKIVWLHALRLAVCMAVRACWSTCCPSTGPTGCS